MIKLESVVINKYKCIENPQEFVVEPQTTVLVGMNESGKTSILEALAKANYFEDDEQFKFNLTQDYPRKQKKAVDKSGENPEAVTLSYSIDNELLKIIEDDIGAKLTTGQFSITTKYDNKRTWAINLVKMPDYISVLAKEYGITDKKTLSAITIAKNQKDLQAALTATTDENDDEEDTTIVDVFDEIKIFFENTRKWDNPIEEYIVTKYLIPNLPKFMYYDDYYMLPSRLSLNNIETTPTDPASKTAKALLELADVDVSKVMQSTNFEDFVAELEATQLNISEELFKYWSTNTNLGILFSIDKKENQAHPNQARIVDHILDIRVQNKRSGVSLPLGNRSKGFNWFFSFLVWFKKIQENQDSTYILLLDEPGLNLHAKAQNDLLRFLTDLSDEYQIIYTTHSPFMIESNKLNQVRTVVEKEDGTHISDSVQEKDPNTLFPLQAALGYDLAQNLFVSPKNLIVEGIADLVYLSLLSEILHEGGKPCLKNDITIVPVGGADKVATFISLLRGNELQMVCLLDTFTDPSAKQRLENMVAQKIIKDTKIVFYHDIRETKHADIEDLFTLDEYLSLYNGAFSTKLKPKDFNEAEPILPQLKKINGGKDFNHYAPANFFAKNAATITLSDGTKDHFEKLFEKINKLL